jgi:hypothetical protein
MNARIKKILVLILCAIGSAVVTADNRMDLVGVWQDSNLMAAGWSNVFQFFPDGHFVFHTNEMDETRRDLGFEGGWRIEAQNLVLTIQQRSRRVGGRVTKDDTGAGAQIAGGKDEIIIVKPAKVQAQLLNGLHLEKGITKFGDSYEMFTVRIGGVDYWQFSNDPRKYP